MISPYIFYCVTVIQNSEKLMMLQSIKLISKFEGLSIALELDFLPWQICFLPEYYCGCMDPGRYGCLDIAH